MICLSVSDRAEGMAEGDRFLKRWSSSPVLAQANKGLLDGEEAVRIMLGFQSESLNFVERTVSSQ